MLNLVDPYWFLLFYKKWSDFFRMSLKPRKEDFRKFVMRALELKLFEMIGKGPG